MKIGDIIAERGIQIRGRIVVDTPAVISSIIKTKLYNRGLPERAQTVVCTTSKMDIHSAKARIAAELCVAETSLFQDEMNRLGAVKRRQDRKVHLGTKHLRKKERITTHAGIKLEEFTFDEAMAITSDRQLRKLGRIHGNFDDIEMRATNK